MELYRFAQSTVYKLGGNMYKNGLELLEATAIKGLRICDIVLLEEAALMERTIEDVREEMREVLSVMLDATSKALKKDIPSVSGLLGGDARRMSTYSKDNDTYCGKTIANAISKALSCMEVNASMGRIVAAPTAGSCGILPASVISAAESMNISQEGMIDGLLTASGIGRIVSRNATVSGAEGGCQAECGSASAMAAAALVEMKGGTPEAALNAAAIAFKNIMGLVCDPVAGLVEVPCAKRNAAGVANAMVSADMALSGIRSVIPFDEVVEAMYRVGREMPASLKETAKGGLAATPTALRLQKEIFGKKG